MLKLKYLFENFDLARDCMELYEYDRDRANELLQYFRISSNAIYPFLLKSGEVCFLRLSPIEEKAASEVKSEMELIQWLIEKNFPAMQPVPMKDGKLFCQVDTEWGNYNVSCFKRVRGDNLEDIKVSLSVVKGYGKILGRLHALMKQCPCGEKRRNHEEFLEEMKDKLQTYGASDVVKNEFEVLNKELKKLSVSQEEYGVIHYDFEPDNVFYDAESGTFSVIDFDDAIRCWYALDVVRALDALDDVIEDADLEEARQCFLAGYRSATAFTEKQENSLPLMRRLVRLQEYATLLHVLSEDVENPPEWMVGLSSHLQNKLAWLEETMN